MPRTIWYISKCLIAPKALEALKAQSPYYPGKHWTYIRLPEPELESILNENTLGSLVMELDRDPVLNIALGNREGATFHKLTFR